MFDDEMNLTHYDFCRLEEVSAQGGASDAVVRHLAPSVPEVVGVAEGEVERLIDGNPLVNVPITSSRLSVGMSLHR